MAKYSQTADNTFLAELYGRYMHLVYGVCLKYLQNTEDAKDAVQDIYTELIDKLLKHKVDNFKGWLHQVSKNHCLMKLRAAKRTSVVSIDDGFVHSGENMHLDDVMEKENNLCHLEYCIDRLPPDQKTAVSMFYLQQKCYKEIAENLSIDWSRVRSFIQNGRRNLKNCMDQQMLKNEPVK